MRIAQKMGETVDSERLQGAMQEIQDRWTREEKKLGRMKKRAVEAVLPVNFQQPGLFRQAMEQKSSPIPMLNIPALPVYFVLVSAIACWCYYGYQYHKVHFTI